MFWNIVLFPYYYALKVRHFLFDKGIKKTDESPVPSICIGNITVGGTGKTPHTEMILSLLSKDSYWKDKNLAVLSRGYKRKSKGFQYVKTDSSPELSGDEPLQIKNKFPGVTVAVDKNRVRGCKILCNPDSPGEKPADLIVLDDAYQYRKLKATMNIVLADYNRPVHKDRLLPAGSLRDLPERMDHADCIIITKCPPYLEEEERKEWLKSLKIKNFNDSDRSGINRIGRKIKVFFTTMEYCPPEKVFEEGDTRYIYSQKLIMFTGIAKNIGLRKYLSNSYKIVKLFCFSDHHRYTQGDMRKISCASEEYPTAVIVTTEKDCQKIRHMKHVPENLRKRIFHIPIKVRFLTEEEEHVFRDAVITFLK